MKRLHLYFAILATGFPMLIANAQTETDSIKKRQETTSDYESMTVKNSEARLKDYIERLEKEKERVAENEKYELRKTVEEINSKLEKGEISPEEAQRQKEEAAKITALNIDNKNAIIENQLALAKRGEQFDPAGVKGGYIELGYGNATDEKGSFLMGLRYNANGLPLSYDKRTYSDMVIGFGLTSGIGDGKTIGDTYVFGESSFIELGIALRTRLFKNSNALRLAYGLSYQFNKMTPRGNKYFVNENGTTTLQDFPYELKQKHIRFDNLVIPVHLEFGPSVKREYKDYFRYSNFLKFNAGIGGYAGINTGTTQRLEYKIDGQKFVDKSRTDYNATKFVYGVSAYVGFGGYLALYAKYDLNPMFENSISKERNISFGMRFDL